MIHFDYRPLRFTDRLVICLAFVPLLYIAGVGRGDDVPPPCENEKEKYQACPKGNPTAKCDTYNAAECLLMKTYTEVYGGDFGCGKDASQTMYCEGLFDEQTPPQPIFAPCSKTYVCEVKGPPAVAPYCVRGDQIGNTTRAALYKSYNCNP